MSDVEHPLVIAVNGFGLNHPASSVRDAAHEAFHGQFVRAKVWHREDVHKKLVRKLQRADLWIHELRARAVEQIVCTHFAVECGPLEDWVSMSVMEAIRGRLPYAELEPSLDIAGKLLGDRETKLAAAKVIKLVKVKS